MDAFLIPTTKVLEALISLVIFLLVYLLYYFSPQLPLLKTWFWDGKQPSLHRDAIHRKRIFGFFILGLFPLSIAWLGLTPNPNDFGLGLPSHPLWYVWLFIPMLILGGGMMVRPRKKIDLTYYPEVKRAHWDKKALWLNGITWGLYLWGYEFLLRGLVFFSLLAGFGFWPALIIHSILYSLIHIFKGPSEAFGAFFLGILFGWITYVTESFWVAFLLHWMMAVLNDLQAIRLQQIQPPSA